MNDNYDRDWEVLTGVLIGLIFCVVSTRLYLGCEASEWKCSYEPDRMEMG